MTRLWLCWAPAPWGAAPRRASLPLCTGGSRAAETWVCICYANNTSFSCTPSAAFLLKSAREGTGFWLFWKGKSGLLTVQVKCPKNVVNKEHNLMKLEIVLL